MHAFRVIDLKLLAEDSEVVVKAVTPERAAKLALGVDLVRSGSKRNLRARVYFQHPGQSLSMVRLYTKVEDGSSASGSASEASSPSP
jgi:hypothetical protein